MREFFADLHIHVGCSEAGQWIKIPTSRRLTVRNILEEAACRKGMQIIGIVDALSPLVQQDLRRLAAEGKLTLNSGGGYVYLEQTVLLLGAEIETAEEGGGLSHTLVFLPDLDLMSEFSQYMSSHIRNINLSSQNAHMPLGKLIDIAAGFDAMIIPAHVFTPHKSLYGSAADRLSRILSDSQIACLSAVELGLSSDAFLADRIAELRNFTFVTDSDAHSLEKIAREYNLFLLERASFQDIRDALLRKGGGRVLANFGLDPRLGKYHRTLCESCGYVERQKGECSAHCPVCNSTKIIKGVFDRIEEIADTAAVAHPDFRAPYRYQIPLEFIPGLGKKQLEKLLGAFGTEMNVIHRATHEAIRQVVGDKLAAAIIAGREGTAEIVAGAGGIYGRVLKK